MKEVFAKPAVGAIIEKNENGKNYILIQTRQKENDCHTNGMIEVVGGKIREYEKISFILWYDARLCTCNCQLHERD